jgi:hypothetical protein
MKTHANWIFSGCAGALLSALALGCSSAGSLPEHDDPANSQVASTQGKLAAYDFGTWPAWAMPVNVCFQKFTTTDPAHIGEIPTATQYTALKNLAMVGLQETWQLVPGVSFINRGNCTSAMSSYLHLELSWNPGAGGWCGAGVGATCSLGGGTDTTADQIAFKGLLAHEVGHGMGFGHEHQRPGNEFPSCEAGRVAGCLSCKAKIDVGQACAAADWNACAAGNPILPSPVTTPQSFSTSSPQYAVIQEMLNNNGPVPSFELLTTYDPFSIMNYCAVPNGRDPNDFRPTALDLLGMEMTYPLNTTYPIGCKSGCFYSGTGVITRTDGAITTNWTARGGKNVSLISPINGQSVTSVGTSGLAAGSSTLTFNFVAPRTGGLLTTSGNLRNSNAYHAAVVGVLL